MHVRRASTATTGILLVILHVQVTVIADHQNVVSRVISSAPTMSGNKSRHFTARVALFKFGSLCKMRILSIDVGTRNLVPRAIVRIGLDCMDFAVTNVNATLGAMEKILFLVGD